MNKIYAGVMLLALSVLSASQTQSTPPSPPPAVNPGTHPNIPDKYTNLQVLPKDITRPELMAVMKNFAKTSNVRCSYCHVATDDLSEADFANDSKPTKLQARELLKAVQVALAAHPAAAPSPTSTATLLHSQ